MRLLHRKVSLESLLDRNGGDINDALDLKVNKTDCKPATDLHIDAKYVENPNYGRFKTNFIYFTIPLTTTHIDIGVYDQYEFIQSASTSTATPDPIVRISGVPLESYLTTGNYILTGQTSSMLDELEYYGAPQINTNYSIEENSYSAILQKTPSFINYVINAADGTQYVLGTGVKYHESFVETRLIYDKKTDSFIPINRVDFEAKGQGWTENNTSLEELVKDDKLIGITSIAEIENGINIDRGGYDVFQNHYILGEVNTLDDLATYRNNYFKLNL
jgi:hypothetical protein